MGILSEEKQYYKNRISQMKHKKVRRLHQYLKSTVGTITLPLLLIKGGTGRC